MEKTNRVSSVLVGLAAITGVVGACLLIQKYGREKKGVPVSSPLTVGKIVIIYGTTTGTAKAFALKLYGKLQAAKRTVELCNMSEYDQEKLVKEDIALIICSTWMDGQPPVSCKGFVEDLRDYAYDFRVSKNLLEKLHFSVFGLGAELYDNNFGKVVSLKT
jgi:sulfite reductase (NADPH) flavoprotein alpha-component